MRKIIALFLTLCLAGSMISCNRVPTDGEDSTEETEYETDSGEDLNSEKILPSVADLVQVPDTPTTYPPIEPGDYGTEPSPGLEYRLSGDYYIVAGMGTCTDAKLVIPAEYEGKPVKGIDAYAFCDKETATGVDAITSVVISEGIEYIDEAAFQGCVNLRNVQLPTTLKTLGKMSFRFCSSLVEITIPEGIQEIPTALFRSCTSLQKVTLPTTIKKINQSAFYNCENLYDINLPEGLEVIEDGVFSGCYALKNIYLPSTLKSANRYSFRSENDTRWYSRLPTGTEMEIPEGYSDGDIRPEGWIHNLYYAGTMEQYLERVASGQFENIYGFAVNFYINGDLLDYLVIPDGMIIPYGAFNECQCLKGIVLPQKCFDSVDNPYEYISEKAFIRCPNLEWIVVQGTLPDDIGNTSWLKSMVDVPSHTNSQIMLSRREFVNTVPTRRLYVACTESEAAPFLQSYLYISNEGLDSYQYPDVEVYYAGEWMFDSEGLPVVIEQ